MSFARTEKKCFSIDLKTGWRTRLASATVKRCVELRPMMGLLWIDAAMRLVRCRAHGCADSRIYCGARSQFKCSLDLGLWPRYAFTCVGEPEGRGHINQNGGLGQGSPNRISPRKGRSVT